MKRHEDPQRAARIAAASAAARTEFAQVLADMDNPDEIMALICDLFSEAEIEAMIDRWRVAPLVAQGMPYREVSERTGVSVTTVGRVARCVERGAGGYRRALAHRRSP